MILNIGGFLLCAGIIFICGRLLSIYGEAISRQSGLGQGWIGLILMASVTSLPELFVGISSAGILQSVDLAAGDVLGSCAFNLAILSLLDWAGKVPLSNRASSSCSCRMRS
jgi:cation:H+ antiporter